MSERAAADILRLTGVDVTGNATRIEPRMIEHILKRHGANGSADHSMADVNDLARVQYVLEKYDDVSNGGKTKAYQTIKPNGKPGQARTVLFSKAVNGTYYVVEAVPDTKSKTVYVVSASMQNKKAGSTQTANADATATRSTSETKNVQLPDDSTIAQPGRESNEKSQRESGFGQTQEREPEIDRAGGERK